MRGARAARGATRECRARPGGLHLHTLPTFNPARTPPSVHRPL
jgi:hypothetical protein